MNIAQQFSNTIIFFYATNSRSVSLEGSLLLLDWICMNLFPWFFWSERGLQPVGLAHFIGAEFRRHRGENTFTVNSKQCSKEICNHLKITCKTMQPKLKFLNTFVC